MLFTLRTIYALVGIGYVIFLIERSWKGGYRKFGNPFFVLVMLIVCVAWPFIMLLLSETEEGGPHAS